eukprot:scaffold33229_cov112-Isochrysis_galbana.AAC.1
MGSDAKAGTAPSAGVVLSDSAAHVSAGAASACCGAVAAGMDTDDSIASSSCGAFALTGLGANLLKKSAGATVAIETARQVESRHRANWIRERA